MDDPLVALEFQNFGVDASAGNSASSTNASKPAATTFHFSNFPDSPGDDPGRNNNEKPNDNNTSTSGASPSFWTFAYYQRFFDVDTDIVVSRIVNSMIPRCGKNFILDHIRPSPDLYGPWWVSVSLIFSIAIASNLEGYFAVSSDKVDYHWSLEFGVVTAAAATIFAYVWLVPLALYSLFWWRKSQENYSFTEILCAYGYSLSIYIPISLLWVVPYSWFQWTLLAVGLILSCSVLVIALWPAVRHDQRLIAFLVMAAIIVVNALLAIGFKMVFFHAVSGPRILTAEKTVLTTMPAVIPNNQSMHTVLSKGNSSH